MAQFPLFLVVFLASLSVSLGAADSATLESLLRRLSDTPVREHLLHRLLEGELSCSECDNRAPALPAVFLRPLSIHASDSTSERLTLVLPALHTEKQGVWPMVELSVQREALEQALEPLSAWRAGNSSIRFSNFANRPQGATAQRGIAKIFARLEESAAAKALVNLARIPEVVGALGSLEKLCLHPENLGEVRTVDLPTMEPPTATLRIRLELELANVDATTLAELNRALQTIARLPSAEVTRLGLQLEAHQNNLPVALRAHVLGACQGTPAGLETLRQGGFAPDQIAGLIAHRICGKTDQPNPSDFIKPGVLGSMAAAVGQFRAVQDPDGKTYIEGLQGLVRQQVRQSENGTWEQVGSLDTVLPCAQLIHNRLTRKRTEPPRK